MTSSTSAPRDDRGIPTDLDESARAYHGFEGRIGRTMAGSEPYWPPRPRAGADAPNVILMLVDDLGYSDWGCFGSEIDTPEVDRLAAEGLRYTNFHVTPMCSPTRAALMTGRNSHAAGVGYVAHADPGYPGFAMELADDVSTIAEVLRDTGYSTLMVGKWHLCKDGDVTESGSKKSWPLQRGFDRFYGFMDGLTNMFRPHGLYRDNSVVTPEDYPEDYYLTDELTDEAISMVRAVKASDASKPFLLYFAHGAVHAPLNAKAEDIERHRGAYEMGWDELRERRLARMKELGIFDEDVQLPPRNAEAGNDVEAWDSLSDDQKRLFARYMEVYAAMVQTIDQSLARLRAALEELDEWDNTFVLLISDNGASREGEAQGSSQYFDLLRHYHGVGDLGGALERDLADIDLIGGPRTLPHYPRGWAMACNTPFRLYKINTHAGGHSTSAVVSWPRALHGQEGQFRRQYTHVTDVFPTLLEICGATNPRERYGVPLKPLAGASFVDSLTNPDAPEHHREQYYEMMGHRGYYRDGWEIVTLHPAMTEFGDHEWQLYNLREDPTETTDLAAEHPELVAELSAAWDRAAWHNQVYPLNEGAGLLRNVRPEHEDVFSLPATFVPGTRTLERYRSLMLVYRRGFDVAVDLEFHSGDAGVLFAHGTQSGGYLLAVENDRLSYHHNSSSIMTVLDCGELADGVRSIGLHVAAFEGGSRVNVRVTVEGEERAAIEGIDMPMGQAMFQGIDIGIDRGSPVSWEIYDKHGTFPYTGRLKSVTWTPGPHAPNTGPDQIPRMRELGLKFE
ncbi:arylsulfatase [Enemella sp. A6]|uniref:arylsulfatase n=1 Tax=Enemella sp. A6 TaxID=3440152 RepID=UPI003EBC6963